MIASQIYILISIIALAIIAAVLFFVRKDKKGKKLTHLASWSLMLILMGIIFGDNRLIGYSFIGIGVLLAILDMINKSKSKKKKKSR